MFSSNLTKLDGQLYHLKLFCSRRQHHRSDITNREQTVKPNRPLNLRRGEPNPEYHRAPSSYVDNYKRHHLRYDPTASTMVLRNPRYRWTDFRRRMVYGTYDI